MAPIESFASRVTAVPDRAQPQRQHDAELAEEALGPLPAGRHADGAHHAVLRRAERRLVEHAVQQLAVAHQHLRVAARSEKVWNVARMARFQASMRGLPRATTSGFARVLSQCAL